MSFPSTDEQMEIPYDGSGYRVEWNIADFENQIDVIQSPEYICGDYGVTTAFDFNTNTGVMRVKLTYRYLRGKYAVPFHAKSSISVLNSNKVKKLVHNTSDLLGESNLTCEFFIDLHKIEITKENGFLMDGSLLLELIFKHKRSIHKLIHAPKSRKPTKLPNLNNTFLFVFKIKDLLPIKAVYESEQLEFDDTVLQLKFMIFEYKSELLFDFQSDIKKSNSVLCRATIFNREKGKSISQSKDNIFDQSQPMIFEGVGKTNIENIENGWLINESLKLKITFQILSNTIKKLADPEKILTYKFPVRENNYIEFWERKYLINMSLDEDRFKNEQIITNSYICDALNVNVQISESEITMVFNLTKGLFIPFSITLMNQNPLKVWKWNEIKFIHPGTIFKKELPCMRTELLLSDNGWIIDGKVLFIIQLKPADRFTPEYPEEFLLMKSNGHFQISFHVPKQYFVYNKFITPYFCYENLKIRLIFSIYDDDFYISIEFSSSSSFILFVSNIYIHNIQPDKSINMHKEIFLSNSFKNCVYSIPISRELIVEANDWNIYDSVLIDFIFNCSPACSHEIPNTILKIPKTIEASSPALSSPSSSEAAIGSTYTSPKSREETSYVGLENQGATCYMNSMLQSLFHLPAFRRIVYNMPTTGTEDVNQSITLNLQRLFCQMQFSKTPCSTKSLTKSFGWGTAETFMQHDVEEFCRVLLDNLMTKMKGTELEDSIPKLFRGKTRSFIRCVNVNVESSRIEEFYDLSLVVKDCPTLRDSFVRYCQEEKLEGENQYSTEEYGKQDANMGLEFYELPSVLQIHLRRFEYDFNRNTNVKIHDRFEFPPEIDLTEFLAKDSPDRNRNNVYELYGVLVHSGGNMGGHYYAFLRTSTDTQWYKFNDTFVSKESSTKAIQDNYGNRDYKEQSAKKREPKAAEAEIDDIEKFIDLKKIIESAAHPNFLLEAKKPKTFTSNKISVKKYMVTEAYHSYSGYFLIYVRKEDAHSIFEPVHDEDVPEHIKNFTNNYTEMKKTKKANTTDNSAIINVSITYENDLKEACSRESVGFDLKVDEREIESTTTLIELYRTISKEMNVSINSIRLWKANSFFKTPNIILLMDSKDLNSAKDMGNNSIRIFVQNKPENEQLELPANHTLLYVKFYCPNARQPIHYIGSFLVSKNSSFNNITQLITEKCKWISSNAALDYYLENISNTNKINTDYSLSQTIACSCGSILIAQYKQDAIIPESVIEYLDGESSQKLKSKDKSNVEENENESEIPVVVYTDIFQDKKYPTIDLYYKTKKIFEVDLYTLKDQEKPICTLKFPSSLFYEEICDLIINATGVDFDSTKDSIALFKMVSNKPTSIDLSKGQTMSYTLATNKKNSIYFQILYNSGDIDNKSMNMVSIQFSMDAHTIAISGSVFVPKTFTCQEIFEEFKSNTKFDFGKGPFRFLSINDCKILKLITRDDLFVSILNQLRVETIPEDQIDLKNGSFLISCSYANRSTFIKAVNVPFLFPVIEEEKIPETIERFANFIGVTKEAFAQYQLAIKNKDSLMERNIKDTDVLSLLATRESILYIITSETKPTSSPVRSLSYGATSPKSQSVKIYN